MYSKLGFEVHERLGRYLFEARNALLEIIVVLPKASKESKALVRALKGVEHARCVMDSKVFKDFGEKDLKELVSVYYGTKDRAPVLRKLRDLHEHVDRVHQILRDDAENEEEQDRAVTIAVTIAKLKAEFERVKNV